MLFIEKDAVRGYLKSHAKVIYCLLACLFYLFRAESNCVAQAALELEVILLPQPSSECQNGRCVPPNLA